MSSMSIGRVYVQPEAKIAVSDFTVKGPQRFILMDRFWGFPINVPYSTNTFFTLWTVA